MSSHDGAIRNGTVVDSNDADDTDEEGWQDVDPDQSPDTFVCLFDESKFDSIVLMFDHCKAKYSFDVWKVQQDFDLDFLGLVKLVNYVRRSVASGDTRPDVTDESVFEDDVYLQPVLENDAVLYNLEEVLTASRTVAKSEMEELKEQMTALQARFDAYREEVSDYLGKKLDSDTTSIDTKPNERAAANLNSDTNGDADYFHGYSFNAIHESMLKDRVRTDAYRDFIYDNKHIFKDKVVLDVGCGTGILSMFCAKAGAKQVIAVDNSEIINTARVIIHANNLDHCIQCLRGKIEDVHLPVQKVDIIVSEWMGYCLLFESMLDSVLFARDRYLADDGLIVPSHATLSIAAIADSELRETHIDFWNNVYGFDMRAMVERTSKECLIRTIDPTDLSGEGTVFRTFDLHSVKVEELSFEAGFGFRLGEAPTRFEGFTIWFDTFFAKSRSQQFENPTLENAKAKGIGALTTSPHHDPTHWQQGICLVNQPQKFVQQMKLQGNILFRKPKQDTRGLDLTITWQGDDLDVKSQSWHLSIV